MGRLIILGIDGLDADYLTAKLGQSPNLRRLSEAGGVHRVQSVFPPDSDSAWATIYTGLTPAQHGILHMESPLEKSARLSTIVAPNSTIKGRTFWDHASRLGLHCAIIFPHLGYPVWPVKGLMIARSSTKNEFSTIGTLPRGSLLRPEHHTIKSFPKRGQEKKYLNLGLDRISAETELFSELVDSTECNLFFAYSSTLDLLEHFLWPLATTSMSSNGFLQRAHQAYDEMVGVIMGRMKSGDRLLVISDHGHGPRPRRQFRIMAYLRANLDIANGSSSDNPTRMKALATFLDEGVLRTVLRMTTHFDLRNTAHNVLKTFPSLGSLIEQLGSRRYVSGLSLAMSSTVKSYSYGGIWTSGSPAAVMEGPPRTKVIELLKNARTPNGSPAFQWVARREEIDDGPFCNRLPDILFQLVEDYSAVDTMGEPLFGPNLEAGLVPGSHRRSAATLIDSSDRAKIPSNLLDVNSVIVAAINEVHKETAQ